MLNASLLVKIRELIKQSHLYLKHCPKSEKYGIVLQIKNLELEIYELSIEVIKRFHKKTTLTNLDIKHQVLRGLWHLYYELGYLNFKDGFHDGTNYENHRFEIINRMIDEIGSMIGGLIKEERAKENQ